MSDHLLESYETLRGKVKRAMGGEALELMRERAERLEREAREQGLEQGIEQGIERGIDDLSAKLQELGVDKAIVEQAAAAMRAENR